MAKYTVTRTCGHTTEHQLVGPNSERERKLAWMAKHPCMDCQRAAEAKVHAAENASSAAANAAAGLPTLAGSEKQVAWAESIRAKMLAELAAIQLNDEPAAKAIHKLYTLHLQAQADAKYWIDNRDAKLADGETMTMWGFRSIGQDGKALKLAYSRARLGGLKGDEATAAVEAFRAAGEQLKAWAIAELAAISGAS